MSFLKTTNGGCRKSGGITVLVANCGLLLNGIHAPMKLKVHQCGNPPQVMEVTRWPRHQQEQR
ncbi:MAG: hypothetical protein ACI85U_003427 [Candidatus Promineifilaceae bacterium]|jgi:hypothetical protein